MLSLTKGRRRRRRRRRKKWRIRRIDYTVWRQRQGCEHRAFDCRSSVFWADFSTDWQVATKRIFCFLTLDRKPRLRSQSYIGPVALWRTRRWGGRYIYKGAPPPPPPPSIKFNFCMLAARIYVHTSHVIYRKLSRSFLRANDKEWCTYTDIHTIELQ